MDRAAAVQQLQDVYEILSSDMEEIVKYGAATPSPFAHRTLVRTLFSLIEGLAFQLRQVTLATLEAYPGQLTAAEIALLREERYSLNKQGEPDATENFQKVLPNLLFTMRCYVKNHRASFKPDLSHHGWHALQKTVGIRNRVTHPKSAADLGLAEEDLVHLVEATAWWKATLLAMFKACNEADQYWRAKLSALQQREDGSQ